MNIRILHLIPNLSGGGAERQFSYLAPELARMGHDVHVAYSKEGFYKPELPGVVLHKLKARSNYDPDLLWQLVRLIRRIRPQIVHSWILQMDILGAIAAKLNSVSWIFREPSSSEGYPQTLKNRLRKLAASGATAIISNSKGGDTYWRKQLPNSRRYVIRNGLPIQEIDRILPTLPPGFPESEVPIVLYVGRLTADSSGTKNLRYFLEAMEYIRKRQSTLGVLCGEGPQRSELEGLIRKKGLEAAIHFAGYLPVASVWALMKRASVFVSLSGYEGCPNTVMEAIACGCPVVLSDIPAHREILDECCALFVDPTTAEQTADVIMRALSDKDVFKARAAIAKLKAREWSIAEMARNYEKVYLNII